MSIPYVIEAHNEGERMYDLYSRMLKDRIIFLRGVFSTEMADTVVAQLLFLETMDKGSDIYMYINSPGGRTSSMYAIYDTMNYIKPDIATLAYGEACSAAAFILSAGTPGKRRALQNVEIMIHEPSTGMEGKTKDVRNYWKRNEKLYEKMTKDMSQLTGQKLSKVKHDMQLDYFMSAQEAKDYGIIDEIQYKRS